MTATAEKPSDVSTLAGLLVFRAAQSPQALAGLEVRIGDNRELQIHGTSVMKGYWSSF